MVVYCQLDGEGPIEFDEWNGLERVMIRESKPGWRGTAAFDSKSIRHAMSVRGPDDVWLTTLSAKSPISPLTNVSTSGAAPSQFMVTGRTYSHDGVARLLSRLQVVPDLINVQLLSSSLSTVAGHDVVEFSIAADIKVAGA